MVARFTGPAPTAVNIGKLLQHVQNFNTVQLYLAQKFTKYFYTKF